MDGCISFNLAKWPALRVLNDICTYFPPLGIQWTQKVDFAISHLTVTTRLLFQHACLLFTFPLRYAISWFIWQVKKDTEYDWCFPNNMNYYVLNELNKVKLGIGLQNYQSLKMFIKVHFIIIYLALFKYGLDNKK